MLVHEDCPFLRHWLFECKPFFVWLTFFIIELAQSFAHNYFSFLVMFVFLQGGRAFALKIAHLKDSELRKLAADLPLRTIEAKAPSTTDRYSRAF